MTSSVAEFLIDMKQIPICPPTKDAVHNILEIQDQGLDTWGKLGLFIKENENNMEPGVVNRVGEMAQAQWDQMKHASDLTMALEYAFPPQWIRQLLMIRTQGPSGGISPQGQAG